MTSLLKSVKFPQYVATGRTEPQQEIEAWLCGLGEPIDVTRNNVVASLRPLMIGVMFESNCTQPVEGNDLRLCFYERNRSRNSLGEIRLRLARKIALPSHRFCLFRPVSCRNHCLDPLSLRLYYLYESWRCRKQQRKNPYNFWMEPQHLRCLFTFYICPRPVVLVSVEHEGSSNIFPMDLIGSTDSPWFSMALRSTSPAVGLMQASKRMALASIPLTYKSLAYDLGKHHKERSIDVRALPFETVRSPLFGLPIPAAALKIREVRVREYHEIGSHMLFITSIVNETEYRPATNGVSQLPMFHIHGTYSQYLRSIGVPAGEA